MTGAGTLKVAPIAGPLRATVRVPGSKSLTNRVLAVAALAHGETTLRGALIADDSLHMVDSLGRLGFRVKVDAAAEEITVQGLGGVVPSAGARLHAGNAGTVARFLTALVALGKGEYLIDGVPRMRERPIADLVEALRQLGAVVDCPTGCPPVRVVAAGLSGGRAALSGGISSQYLSALLIAAPYARSPVELVVDHALGSRPYVDMTLAVMAEFGVEVSHDGYHRFLVPQGRYRPRPVYRVESDASAASYFFAAAAVVGGTVRVEGISRRSCQGDIAFLDILAAMGCLVEAGEDWIEVTRRDDLRGVDVDLGNMPDTAQTLAALAPFAASPTVVRGIASARLKECDRVAATCTELARLGVRVAERPDGFTIHPASRLSPATVRTYDDHRMAMAFSLVGLRVPGLVIENPSSVSKTFPRFFEVLDELRLARL